MQVYTGEFGLQELLDKSQDILAEEDLTNHGEIAQEGDVDIRESADGFHVVDQLLKQQVAHPQPKQVHPDSADALLCLQGHVDKGGSQPHQGADNDRG